MKNISTIIFLIISSVCFSQKKTKYMVVQNDTTGKGKFSYFFTNLNGDTITKLDTAKYTICFSDTIQYFAIVGLRNKSGWWAIDKNEKPLFQIYNTSSGEPSPDQLREGMIRIVGKGAKIGFANYKGEIVIRPQFEAATSFYKGKSIIGRKCRQILWCCKGENEDKHYIIDCNQAGYINKKGQVQKIGNWTFEQIKKEIGWKSVEDEE